MLVHVLQHAPVEGLAAIEPLLAARGAKISTTRLFDNQPLPSMPGFDLVIAMGGPMSVNDEAEFPWLVAEKQFIRDTITRGAPLLGVCLGSQLIASALGARVYPNKQKEIGWFPIEAVRTPENTFRFPEKLQAFHWHGETFDLPAGAIHLARSSACANQAFQVGRRTIALQCHLEVTSTAIHDFTESFSSELLAGPFIQTKVDIESAPPSAYTEMHRWMERVIEYLIG